jgi:hypothetical protein
MKWVVQAFFIILVLFLALFSSHNLLSPFPITLSALFSKPQLYDRAKNKKMTHQEEALLI